MSKSVLFVINGFGMGNATRCEALIELLDSDYTVDIITSDKALVYFTGHPRIRRLTAQQNIQNKETLRYGTFLFFLVLSWSFLKRLFINYGIQKKQIAQNSYEAIFFDSDYSFILHKLQNLQVKIIGVNNAFEVICFFKRNFNAVNLKILPSLMLEILDFTCYRLFSTYILCPCVDVAKLHPASEKVLTIPLLVRTAFFKSTLPTDVHSLLVMSSSSNVESDLNKILPLVQHKKPYALVNTFEKDNISTVLESSLIICNGGQSSLAECLYLNKPSLVVNIPNHAEQLSNVLLAAQFGIVPYQDKSLEQIEQLLSDLPRPRYAYSYDDLKLQVKSRYKKIFNAL